MSAPARPPAWYVAFVDRPAGQPRRWWDIFTRPGWRHVLAFRYDAGAGVWLLVDPLWSRTLVTAIRPGAEFGAVLGGLSPVLTAVLRVDMPAVPDRLPRLPRIGGWCVPATAHLLGLRCRALAPLGLWRELLRRGAVPVMQELCLGCHLQPEDTEARSGGA